MQLNALKCLLLILLSAVLTSCGQDLTQSNIKQPIIGFGFSIDPVENSVTYNNSDYGAYQVLASQEKLRSLVPGVDLQIEDLNVHVLDNNNLVMELRVRNVTEDHVFMQPFSFTATSNTQNVQSTTEPSITTTKLGGDGRLEPNELSEVLKFEVEHKGTAFTYQVAAKALVDKKDKSE